MLCIEEGKELIKKIVLNLKSKMHAYYHHETNNTGSCSIAKNSHSQRQCNDNSSSSRNTYFNAKNLVKLSRNYAKFQQSSAYNKCIAFNLSLVFGIWCLLQTIAVIQGAAVYTNVDFHANPTFEPICHHQEEHFIESEGKESSLILEFNPAVLKTQHKSCTRILSSPPNYGFIVRLILPKIRHRLYSSTKIENKENQTVRSGSTPASAVIEGGNKGMSAFMDKLNASSTGFKSARSCALSIFSSHNPHTPEWRVDPCQLEDTAPEMEDPVRLFHGRIRIVWEHYNHTLNSKLMVTVLGKGDECRSEKKHQCLKIGDEPILCISKDLICDGIRHCPYSNEYDSDEDYNMCWKRSRLGGPIPPSMESDVFEHFALEVFRNLFAFDVPTITKATSRPFLESDDDFTEQPAGNKTMLHKVTNDTKSVNDAVDNEMGMDKINNTGTTSKVDNATNAVGAAGRGRNPRLDAARETYDLSKYGPWGYLLVGMLFFGVSLFVCGVWASASQHAAGNEATLEAANAAAMNQDNHSTITPPPNYEELDPPPAYSVLFPNYKASSSTTLNSQDGSNSQPTLEQLQHLQLTPSAAPSSRSTLRTTPDRASGSNQDQVVPPANNSSNNN